MFLHIYIFFITILLSFFFFIFLNKFIAKKIGLYDRPSKYKIHKNIVPLTGGFFFLFLILIFFILNLIFKIHPYKECVFIFISCLIIFFIGLIDDKINIKPLSRIIILFIILLSIFASGNIYLVSIIKINFGLSNYLLFHKNFDHVAFSAITLLTFMILINITDGINGLISALAIISSAIMLFYGASNIILITLIISSSVCFLVMNLQSKIFLGSSGNSILSFLIYIVIVENYNRSSNIDLILIIIIFILPLLDSVRLFIVRIKENKNPFSRDLNHFHYIIKKKFKKFYLIIYLILNFIPFFLYKFFIPNLLIILSISVIFYLLSLIYFKKIKE